MRIRSLFLSTIILLLSFSGFAQKQVQYNMNKDELMAKRKELMDAINETESQLQAIKKDKNATLGQLRVLQNKLAERQNLIGNINDEIGDIDNTIQQSSKEVVSLRQKLDQLTTRYAQSIRYAYETRSSYDMLAFLFSSSDFNDAMRRMKYLKKFREYRKQQVEQIHETQNQLQHKIGVLNEQKAQKDELLNTQVQQKQKLIAETSQTNQVIQALKGREGELMKEADKNRRIAARVNKAINDVIQREMAKAAKEAEEEEKRKMAAAAKAPATTAKTGKTAENEPTLTRVEPRPKAPRGEAPTLFLTPTDLALASNFEENRGKLYWPVEKGYITDHFGTHPHPLAPKVMIENAGVDIQTTPNATVKAVFEGTVSSIINLEGIKIVMIEHGNYFTVYNNLSSASVSKGQHVSTNQPIGVVADNDEGVPTIKFQIWKSSGKKEVKLNPELWLSKPR